MSMPTDEHIPDPIGETVEPISGAEGKPEAVRAELGVVPSRTPYRSLWGALKDLGPAPSAEEIDEARREAWANFPREHYYE